MNFALLVGQVANGIVNGAGYAVVAIGLTYTLGLARIMNFAFGAFYMLGAFVSSFLITRLSFPYLGAAPLVIVVTSLFAWIFSRLVVLPTLPIPAPLIGANMVRVGSTDQPVRNLMLRLTQLFNLTGHPAISLPCGVTKAGFPCGLQLAGARMQTDALLRIALAIENVLDR